MALPLCGIQTRCGGTPRGGSGRASHPATSLISGLLACFVRPGSGGGGPPVFLICIDEPQTFRNRFGPVISNHTDSDDDDPFANQRYTLSYPASSRVSSAGFALQDKPDTRDKRQH
ncbi:unnamed protein product [Schistocephalus solidus]|uniref:Secreted protein n=1 Tax=Schistocephalus solidus TaxID=70667 RepID=A0A183TSN6_SCHSO|nr:unnamed protein product [Schistocephalus solidus]